MDKQALAQLLELYLQLNPTPSDAQFHQLAGSIGVDKEELEAVAYQMLGEEIQHEEGEGDVEQLENLETEANKFHARLKRRVSTAGDTGLSESQEVLDGDYDPQTTTTDDLLLNDGAPAGTSSQQGTQDATLNDGVADTDVGIDMGPSDQDSTIADGIAPVQLKAAARLMAVSNEKAPKTVKLAQKVDGMAPGTELTVSRAYWNRGGDITSFDVKDPKKPGFSINVLRSQVAD